MSLMIHVVDGPIKEISGHKDFSLLLFCLQPPKRPNALCGICLKGPDSNKKGLPEDLIHCSQCENSGMSNFAFVYFL